MNKKSHIKKIANNIKTDKYGNVIINIEDYNLLYKNAMDCIQREEISALLEQWKDNLNETERHNAADYGEYRTGLIDGLEFAIDELEGLEWVTRRSQKR